MKLLSYLLIIPLLLSTVLGDIAIAKPLKGQTFRARDGVVRIEVDWQDSRVEPDFSQFDELTFTICTGTNNDIQGIRSLKKIAYDEIEDDNYILEVPASIGTDGPYFIQIYAATKRRGFTINYSQRFNLEGMTGTEEAHGNDPVPPDGQISLEANGHTFTTERDLISLSFDIHYTSQNGLTKYAPMQVQPGSTITKTKWSRRYDTSAVSYFSKIKNEVSVESTITPGWNYTMSSDINYASPAANPTQVPWYNPKDRLRPVSRMTPAITSTAN
ncbi:Cell wall synthesis protein [Wickerhamomyces ciferrii]|uniref:Cell wall synthesis protein n=1 Tax=Wickerhamomyces ciferrii (strain ATCC 14091 / BCRC 22168 / CBS 111 / JCM 3599 / NBRC 0793 / NRRL Y-1031 F-60-10) TaxID=1206466 RepID=K0L000_WICCF|nr:Cell wall synthesis protein [Wickerhamomyces ciferrii]CCH46934.1 Cell wall synthesis protein [Wickerhamomyces ciferrii]